MKKRVLSLLTIVILAIMLVSCGTAPQNAGDSSPTYTEDTTIGTGSKEISVEVKTPDSTINLTVKTDEENLGKALEDSGLIKGEEGPYGLYIKEVNGIAADYDTDKSYWAFTIDGESSVTGVDSVEALEGVIYGFSRVFE